MNSEPSSEMLRSDSSELSTDQAKSGAGQGRHKAARKIEFRTSPRKVNISCAVSLQLAQLVLLSSCIACVHIIVTTSNSYKKNFT